MKCKEITKKNQQNVPAEIGTSYVPDMSLDHHSKAQRFKRNY